MRLVPWIALGVILWIASVVTTTLDIRDDLVSAERELTALTDVSDPLVADVDEILSSLEAAEASLGAANRGLTATHMRPVRWVPIVGRQYRSASAMTKTTHRIATEAVVVVREALALRSAEPSVRPAMIEAVGDGLARLESIATAPDLGPDDGLVTALARARNSLAVELGEVAVTARQGASVMRGLGTFLDESDYVVLGANNAEMQLAAGMPLSVGQIRVQSGSAELLDFGPAEERFPVNGVEPPEDLAALWGFLQPTNDVRKLALSPRFESVVGPLAVEMWGSISGRSTGGAVLVDPLVFGAILSVTGPVQIEGNQLTAESAIPYLLTTQYEEFETTAVRDERRDRLGLLAGAVVEALAARDWDPLELLRALRPLVRGGHLLLFDERDEVQAGWRAVGAAGAVDGDETGVFLLNLGASKLDPFIDVSVDVTTTEVDGSTEYSYSIEISNRADDSLPPYVLGPWDAIGLSAPGVHLARLAVVVPAGAVATSFDGTPTLEVNGADGPIWMVVTRVEVSPGSTEAVVFRWTGNPSGLELIPSARVPATTWTWDGTPIEDLRQRLGP